ncbi:MAG: acetyl-CoA carboxylase biotin carboxyl carrier protein subunit [Acidimicrobiaceae bacterium]|nr:acetyl-CoA carboxylase biotin carboxyl carrier protein subunit [Acidimicrobiaceae bacterium]
MSEVRSPMAGLVVKVATAVGAELNIGNTVVVLESMKLEIPVETTSSGRVVEIKVTEGDFVEEANVLVVLE